MGNFSGQKWHLKETEPTKACSLSRCSMYTDRRASRKPQSRQEKAFPSWRWEPPEEAGEATGDGEESFTWTKEATEEPWTGEVEGDISMGNSEGESERLMESGAVAGK